MFMVSVTLYRAAGISFTEDNATLWQVADTALLKNSLLETLFYQHSQPPLFNLMTGLLLKTGFFDIPAYTVFLSMSFGLCVLVYRIQRLLGTGRKIGLAVTALFVFSPPLILYTHWYFYTLPAAFLLTLSVYILFFAVKSGKRSYFLMFFLTIAALSLLRSLFHLIYIPAVLLLIIRLVPKKRNILITAFVLPFILVSSFYLKNLLLYGKFSASSWSGMNLWTMTTGNLDKQNLRSLYNAGEISEISLIKRFSEPGKYPDKYHHIPDKFKKIDILSQRRKKNGFVNYDYYPYIAISEKYSEDAVKVFLRRPFTLIKGLGRSWFGYFKSASDYGYLFKNSEEIQPAVNLYDYFLYGKIPLNLTKYDFLPIRSGRRHYFYLFLFLGLPLLYCYVIRSYINGGPLENHAARTITALILFNIAFTALVGNSFETGENNRFRFMTDPLYTALAGYFLSDIIRKLKTGKQNAA